MPDRPEHVPAAQDTARAGDNAASSDVDTAEIRARLTAAAGAATVTYPRAARDELRGEWPA